MKKRMKDGRALVAVSPRTADILDGIEDLSTWSTEELLRGQRKSKNGHWVGRPPEVIPRVLHEEVTRRRMSKAYDLLKDSTLDAVQLLDQVINDLDAPLAERIKAAELVLSRTMPKSQQLDVKLGIAEPPAFMRALEGAIVILDHGEADVIDAEVIEDDDEDLVFD